MSQIIDMSESERIEAIANHYSAILSLIGEDVSREGLVKTPMRAAKALWRITSGYRQNTADVIKQAVFEWEGSNMVIVKDIEFYSMCEHHILPFFGKISIGYIPDGKIVGLSKLARAVEVVARKLQVQERLTAQVCRQVMNSLNPKGVIVVCNAEHLCMKMRGVEKQNSSTTTVDYCGVFASDMNLRNEFFNALKSVQ